MKLVQLAITALLSAVCVTSDVSAQLAASDSIPLPEHPRPDFERAA